MSRRRLYRLVIGLFSVGAALAAACSSTGGARPLSAEGTPSTSTTSSSSPTAVVAADPATRAKDALAIVRVYQGDRVLWGVPGVLVADSTYVVTSLNAVSFGEQLRVHSYGSTGLDRLVVATPVAFDESLNLAVLRLEASAGRSIPWTKSEPKVGDAVVIAGYDRSFQVRVEGAEIAEITRGGGGDWMRTVVMLPEGASSGVMVNSTGDLIGVATNPQGGLVERTHFLSTHSADAFLAAAVRRSDRVRLPLPPVVAPDPSRRPQSTLPYKAYGSGLNAGQVVSAVRVASRPAVVGRAVADARGNWDFNVLEGAAVSGDVIELWLDGRATGVSFVFAPGRFPATPGFVIADGASRP